MFYVFLHVHIIFITSSTSFIFQSRFRFTPKLSRRYSVPFPHNPSPHSCRTGHYQHPASGCAFARTDDSSRHRIITQGPQRALGFTLGAAYSVGFDKRIMTGTHHCSIIQNGFTALKILCTLPFHSSLFPTLANH